MANIETSYMGLPLKNPLVLGSSGLTSSVNNIIKYEKAGAGAVVLKSLFEEQINNEVNSLLDMNRTDAAAVRARRLSGRSITRDSRY